MMMCLTPFGPVTVRIPSLELTVVPERPWAWVETPPDDGVLTRDS